jgi:hypothetical protein
MRVRRLVRVCWTAPPCVRAVPRRAPDVAPANAYWLRSRSAGKQRVVVRSGMHPSCGVSERRKAKQPAVQLVPTGEI